jgi:hypothetical protein
MVQNTRKSMGKYEAEALLHELLDFYKTARNVLRWINYVGIISIFLSIWFSGYSYRGYGANVWVGGLVVVILILNNLAMRFYFVTTLKHYIEMIFDSNG